MTDACERPVIVGEERETLSEAAADHSAAVDGLSGRHEHNAKHACRTFPLVAEGAYHDFWCTW